MSRILRILLVLVSLSIVGYAATYFDFGIHALMNSKSDELLGSTIYRTMFYLHIVGGMGALIFGPFQFFPNIRKNNINLHRKMGMAYVYSVFLSSFFGLFIAYFATGGIGNQIGFAISSIIWFYFTLKGLLSAKDGDIISHEKWMIRSFSMAAFAITLRIWLGLGELTNLGFDVVYQIAAWVFILNLLIGEWFVKRAAKE